MSSCSHLHYAGYRRENFLVQVSSDDILGLNDRQNVFHYKSLSLDSLHLRILFTLKSETDNLLAKIRNFSLNWPLWKVTNGLLKGTQTDMRKISSL